MRLMVPSLATPVGGVIAGSLMHRGYRLCVNVRLGTAMMLLGNLLALSLGTSGQRWKEFVYLIPANLGLGLTNPSVLFSFISLFEHRGKRAEYERGRQIRVLTLDRTSRGHVHSVPDSIHGHHLWRDSHLCHCPKRLDNQASRGIGRRSDGRVDREIEKVGLCDARPPTGLGDGGAGLVLGCPQDCICCIERVRFAGFPVFVGSQDWWIAEELVNRGRLFWPACQWVARAWWNGRCRVWDWTG